MQTHIRSISLTLSAMLLGLVSACSTAPTLATPTPPREETSGALFDTVAALDSAAFEAFNTCSEPGQLQKHAQFFSEAVEFYHDKGGVTWSRAEMLANTAKFVCGNFSRELVPGSLRVYPIKDFGAIAQGVHRFCQFKSGKCEGAAQFLIVWRQEAGEWRITRVLSFGHVPT